VEGAAQEPSGAGTGDEATGDEATGDEAAETATAASGVIRGDNPHAAGLANVWLELRTTLSTLADPAAQTRRVRLAVKPPANPESAGPAEGTDPEDPDAPAAAGS
jgi:hypothetical protein